MSCRAARVLVQLRFHNSARSPTVLQQTPDVVSSSAVYSLEAFLAALLFAAHPIHTEAVAGIVGHAELLCAALALLALITYVSAASVLSCTQHYRLLAASICMLWLAALAKEIGITMVSCSCRIHQPCSKIVWTLSCCL